MSEWKEELLAQARHRWHTPTGLLLALVAVLGPLVLVFANIDLAAVSWVEWAVVCIAGIAVAAFWAKTRIRRVGRGKVGFGVAVAFEDADEERRVRSDFVQALRGLLDRSRFRHRFDFREFPSQVGESIVDDDAARRLALGYGLHFLLFGRARVRQVSGRPSLVIDLRGLVRHEAVDQWVAAQFREEFSASLPSRLVMPCDLLSCEFAARHIDIVAKYIIATAALFSRDIPYSQQLLGDAEASVHAAIQEANSAPLSALLDRIQRRICDVSYLALQRSMNAYRLKREKSALEAAEVHIRELRKRGKEGDYGVCLAAAICAFVLRRDLVAARAEVAKCQKVDDATWRYSEAFLLAYDGDLQAAYRAYAKAFAAPLRDPTSPTQTEEFIQIILEEEPDRYWLYYCLGLINERAKNDIESSLRDFKEFLARADEERFPTEVRLARRWVAHLGALEAQTGEP